MNKTIGRIMLAETVYFMQLNMIKLEIRLFNKLYKFARNGAHQFKLDVPQDITYGELLEILNIPENKVFLALRNGRNIKLFPLNDIVNNGEIIALSGPVPYSRGYGAPVVWSRSFLS